jgi:hypothetical protein
LSPFVSDPSMTRTFFDGYLHIHTEVPADRISGRRLDRMRAPGHLALQRRREAWGQSYSRYRLEPDLALQRRPEGSGRFCSHFRLEPDRRRGGHGVALLRSTTHIAKKNSVNVNIFVRI